MAKLKSTKDQAASILREAIITGKYKAGESLILKDIADEIGVSITPIREAFQVLANEGLITLQANKRAIVSSIDRKYIEDYYKTRIVLECASVEEFCHKKAELSELEQICTNGQKAIDQGDYTKYLEYNHQFHQAIWMGAGNDRITSLLTSLWMSNFIDELNSTEANTKNSNIEHNEILKALRNYDAEKAKELMRQHIEQNMKRVLNFFPS